MQKTVVLSFRDNSSFDFAPELIKESRKVIFSTPNEGDTSRILMFKSQLYKISMSDEDISKAAQNERLHNLIDIERFLTRTYLSSAIKREDYSVFLSHLNSDSLKVKSFYSSIYRYLQERAEENDKDRFPHLVRVNAELINYFIKETYSSKFYDFIDDKRHFYIDGLYFEMDTIRYYLFASESFKTTILEIIQNAIDTEE